jgi:hypothetical protein
MHTHTSEGTMLRKTLVIAACAALLITVGATPAMAATITPNTPPPWPQLTLDREMPDHLQCTDPDGTVVYDGGAFTIAPAIRGPLFAPTVIWLTDFSMESVVPLEFKTTGYPIFWSTDDGGPHAEGSFEHAAGRPQGYGSVPTDTAPRITCGYTRLGHFLFGRYKITAPLAAMIEGMPTSMIGRTLTFDGEGIVSFTTPKYLFPTRAAARAAMFPTVNQPTYPETPLPTTTCVNSDTHTQLYKGAASTSPPLVHGFHWAPVEFWLTGDRAVTPRWSETKVTGTWQTVDGGPARSGSLNMTESFPPNGFYYQQSSINVHCRFAGHDGGTFVATYPLVAQLGLPLDLALGDPVRTIRFNVDYTTDAQTGTWLFPPK